MNMSKRLLLRIVGISLFVVGGVLARVGLLGENEAASSTRWTYVCAGAAVAILGFVLAVRNEPRRAR